MRVSSQKFRAVPENRRPPRLDRCKKNVVPPPLRVRPKTRVFSFGIPVPPPPPRSTGIRPPRPDESRPPPLKLRGSPRKMFFFAGRRPVCLSHGGPRSRGRPAWPDRPAPCFRPGDTKTPFFDPSLVVGRRRPRQTFSHPCAAPYQPLPAPTVDSARVFARAFFISRKLDTSPLSRFFFPPAPRGLPLPRLAPPLALWERPGQAPLSPPSPPTACGPPYCLRSKIAPIPTNGRSRVARSPTCSDLGRAPPGFLCRFPESFAIEGKSAAPPSRRLFFLPPSNSTRPLIWGWCCASILKRAVQRGFAPSTAPSRGPPPGPGPVPPPTTHENGPLPGRRRPPPWWATGRPLHRDNCRAGPLGPITNLE